MKILITGATSNIAFLTGTTLASRKHTVYMTTKTDKEKEILEEKIKYLKLDVKVFKLDVTNSDDRNKIKDLDLDIIFLHAGIGYGGKLKDINPEKVKENFEVNVFSNLELIQLFLKNGNQDKNRKVVVTSSCLSNYSVPYFGSYSMTKTSINIMVNTFRREEILSNTKFILIKPWAYKTGFNEYLIYDSSDIVSPFMVNLLLKIFNLIEFKNINGIVCKIIRAIEIGDKNKYVV